MIVQECIPLPHNIASHLLRKDYHMISKLMALLLNLFCYFKIKRILTKIKCETRRTFIEYTLGNNLLSH